MERLGLQYASYGGFLYPMLALGAFSVFHWHFSGDLRLYIVVQGYPTLIIPVLMYAFPQAYSRDDLLIAAFACNIFCKICEGNDKRIWRMTGKVVSGHTLKHLWASLLPVVALYYLAQRNSVSHIA